ncbi:MAG: glycosyltransferase family 2 protein [Phycisphaerae bacterium]|nr:glycosyltransferase family 2 protein [Phycisphaerae bacterium]
MKLSIVIPAFNEEEAIGSTVQRCLDARPHLVQTSPVRDVEIIVVSDGSVDRTESIARAFDNVQVIAFEQNRGYGAAIKAGFDIATGDLLGFLDADGTCDPRFFADLSNALMECDADVALGSRMGPRSRMPRVRRIGNRLYALLLGALSNRMVSDTASGMRVIRREALPKLLPLPDGLHFTPAMSARVLMDDELLLVERPMAYAERIGRSKLSVVRDGVRFLRTILHMTLMWRPSRLLLLVALTCFVFMIGLAAYPIESWLRQGRFGEDMIYRLLFCSLLGSAGVTMVSSAMLTDLFRFRVTGLRVPHTFFEGAIDRFFTNAGCMAMAAFSAPFLIWLVGPGLWSRFFEGVVTIHWSRVVLAGLVVLSWMQMAATTLVANVIRFHAARSESIETPATTKRRRDAVPSRRPASRAPAAPELTATR